MNVNKYKINDLKAMTTIIKTINISDDEEFDYLRIISMKNKGVEDDKKNILFFPITIDQTWVDEGWVSKTTDLKTPIQEITEKFPNYTFVVEENMLDKITSNTAKLIVVPDIMKSIDDLYNYIISHNEFEVVSVTGSAGKTTSVGIIENVLKEKYNVLRIYSDRITPIVLKANVINFFNKSYDIIALEMGIYYKQHVKALSDLLNPTMAAIINIGDAHLGTGGLDSIEAICMNKAKIFEYAKYGFVNRDNSYLEKLNVNDKKLYYENEYICNTNLEKLESITSSKAVISDDNKLILDGLKVNVPILTNLSVTNFLLAYEIGKKLGISSEQIVNALNKFTFVENRLQRATIFGKEVIFDGDSSFKERIHQLSLHLYKKAYLVLREYGSDYYDDDFVGVKDYFKNFDKVYLFEGINYLDELKKEPNVIVVNNHDFLKDLDGQVFYHYHDYFYKFDTIKEENLKVEGEIVKKNILLIHGWDYELYSKMTKSNDSWGEYKKLVSALEERYNVYKLNLPGFCHEKEPKEKEWNVTNFAQYVDKFIKDNKLNIDIVLGYSFGGPVSVRWKKISNSNAKLFLIAPAIIRDADNSKKFLKTPQVFDKIRALVRNLYVIHVVKNNEMKYGTKFLRNSYQLIVREDLRSDLFSLNASDIKIVYGTNDTAVAPQEMLQTAPAEYKNNISMIKDANHDNIITDYVEELMDIMDKYF